MVETKDTKSYAPPKKESIQELSKMVDSVVKVRATGGRELVGVLRGYDDLVNLVLDDCEEHQRDVGGTELGTRKLGLVVVRGTQVSIVSPMDGAEEIANPFVGQADDE